MWNCNSWQSAKWKWEPRVGKSHFGWQRFSCVALPLPSILHRFLIFCLTSLLLALWLSMPISACEGQLVNAIATSERSLVKARQKMICIMLSVHVHQWSLFLLAHQGIDWPAFPVKFVDTSQEATSQISLWGPCCALCLVCLVSQKSNFQSEQYWFRPCFLLRENMWRPQWQDAQEQSVGTSWKNVREAEQAGEIEQVCHDWIDIFPQTACPHKS